MKPNPSLLPMAAAATASILFGASVVATRYVVGQTDPVTLASLRYLLACICLLPPLWWQHRLSVERVHVLPIAALGVLFFGIFPWSFSAALQYISASRGATVLALMPLLTLMLAWLYGRETATRNKLAGVALTFAGVALALSGNDPQAPISPVGIALMLLTAVCGAVYNVFARPFIVRYSPLSVTALSMLAGTLFLLPLMAWRAGWEGVGTLTPSGWLAVLFLGLPGGALGFWLWSWALGRIAPTRVAVFVTLNPMAATVLAALWLGEVLGIAFLGGLAAVLVGIVLANRREG